MYVCSCGERETEAHFRVTYMMLTQPGTKSVSIFNYVLHYVPNFFHLKTRHYLGGGGGGGGPGGRDGNGTGGGPGGGGGGAAKNGVRTRDTGNG